MKLSSLLTLSVLMVIPLLFAVSLVKGEELAVPLTVGAHAPEFMLAELGTGEPVSLKKSLERSPVVLVVLRGYPGYQCPLCTRQVGALIQAREKIAATNAEVIMVYPGLDDGLEMKAKEFFQKHTLPKNFTVVTDHDYRFTKLYNLRWDAPRETAYPSTFVIDQDGKIVFAKISRGHGDRSNPQQVLKALEGL